MKSSISITSSVVFVGLVAGLALYGCASETTPTPIFTGTGGASAGTGGSSAGTGGVTGSGGSITGSGGDTSGTGGTTPGTGGSTPGTGGTTPGTGGSTPGTGGTTPPDGGGTGGTTGTGGAGGMGGAPSNLITAVVPSSGCGKAPGATGMRTIATMGVKPAGCADSRCGAWSYQRQYFVTLPAGYVNTKAYPLAMQGPGCGGGGANVYPLDNGVGNTVIRIGVTPPPNAIGHATNPNQGCFDDKEGDDNVDFVMYEVMHDLLSSEFCIDKNRVFAGGNSSGAWWSNELGCHYAGDAMRPIRGIHPNTGGLPEEARFKPTCTTKGMAGFWSHEVGDTTNPFSGNLFAIARAMQVNGCTMGTGFNNAPKAPFPIGGGNGDNTCKRIQNCDPLFPIVVCDLPGSGHGSHDGVVNAGVPTFMRMFSAGIFITQ